MVNESSFDVGHFLIGQFVTSFEAQTKKWLWSQCLSRLSKAKMCNYRIMTIAGTKQIQIQYRTKPQCSCNKKRQQAEQKIALIERKT
jgi:hypothetical protein